MINDFEDFCTWMYVIIDDLWQQIAPLFKRPGPQPDCSDSELLTLAIVGECRSWDVETEMLSYWQEHRDLFPDIPSQSRFNRRWRNLMLAFNLVRHSVTDAGPGPRKAERDRQFTHSSGSVLSGAGVHWRLAGAWRNLWQSAFQERDHLWLQIASLDYRGRSHPGFRTGTCQCDRLGGRCRDAGSTHRFGCLGRQRLHFCETCRPIVAPKPVTFANHPTSQSEIADIRFWKEDPQCHPANHRNRQWTTLGAVQH